MVFLSPTSPKCLSVGYLPFSKKDAGPPSLSCARVMVMNAESKEDVYEEE